MKQASFLKINPADSVVVCLRPMTKGEVIDIDDKQISLLQDTPAGHKVLINDVKEGQDIIKYGYPIGHARKDLKAGEWVNENNLKTNLSGTLEYEYKPVDEKLQIAKENRTFKGYVRKNGDVGVRNESSVRKQDAKASTASMHGTTTTVVRNFLKTMKTHVKYFVTSACTRMQVQCWCCHSDAKTTNQKTSWPCLEITIKTA